MVFRGHNFRKDFEVQYYEQVKFIVNIPILPEASLTFGSMATAPPRFHNTRKLSRKSIKSRKPIKSRQSRKSRISRQSRIWCNTWPSYDHSVIVQLVMSHTMTQLWWINDSYLIQLWWINNYESFSRNCFPRNPNTKTQNKNLKCVQI